MLWKDFAEKECCDDCPLLKAEICPAGFYCYGGQPSDPPCAYFDDDTDMEEWVNDYFEQMRRREALEDARIKEERKKKEIAKKAADTRRALRDYCRNELYLLKRAKIELQAQINVEYLAASAAEAINFANEMFRYEDRVQVKPEISEHVKRLKEEVEKAEKAYQNKREEFYKKRRNAYGLDTPLYHDSR